MLPDDIENAFSAISESSEWILTDDTRITLKLNDTISILNCAVNLFHTVYVVLDGISECAETDRLQVLQILQRIVSGLEATHLKLFITTRETIDVKDIFDNTLDLPITAAGVTPDIKLYITARVWGMATSGVLKISDDQLKKEIVQVLSEKAYGMLDLPLTGRSGIPLTILSFLWVNFQLINLAEKSSSHGIWSALQKLPKDLPETYLQILKNQYGDIWKRPSDDLVMAQRIFK